MKRSLPQIEDAQTEQTKLNEGHFFQLILDAITIREIQKARRQLNRDDENEYLSYIYVLSSFVDSSGVRARRAILDALDAVAVQTRYLWLPTNVAEAVAHTTYDALPIRNLRVPSEVPISATELELMEYGIAIGLALSYDGALYRHNMRIVDAGGELLWRILRYARINEQEALRAQTLDSFDTAEDGAKRSGDPDAVALLQLYRKHGLEGDWRNPEYGERLLERIS